MALRIREERYQMTTEKKPKSIKAIRETSCFRCIWPINKGESYYRDENGHALHKSCYSEEYIKR